MKANLGSRFRYRGSKGSITAIKVEKIVVFAVDVYYTIAEGVRLTARYA